MAQKPQSPETQSSSIETVNKASLVVSQPQKLENLLSTLETIGNFSDKVSEGHSGDWSGGGTASSGTQGDDDEISARDAAIANLPIPAVMQRDLQRHIKKEVKSLQKEVRKITRLSKPGNAHKLNQLYARIRRLNNLLADIFGASVDVVKRLFIRVFIDKQSVL